MKPLLVVISMCAWANGLDRPLVGFVRDSGGSWHSVEGIGGAFVVGPGTEEDHAFVSATDLRLERRENGFYLVDGQGSTINILPPDALCATLLDRGAVFATSNEIVFGSVRFGLTGVTGLRAISPEFVQVSSEGGEYLLRVEAEREALFRLPPLNPEEEAQ